MTKSDIVSDISQKTGINNSDIKAILDAFFETIKHSLETGKTVYLRRFGTFENKRKAPKIARNIKTNTSILIEEHFAPHFKPSKLFTKRIKTSEDLKKNLIK